MSGFSDSNCSKKEALLTKFVWMFYSYVLRSEKEGTYYYGHTQDLDARLRRHNLGQVRFTKNKRPWKLIYFEGFQSKSEAYQREIFYKSIAGYQFLKNSGIT